jgi:hypothetical protein
VEISGLTGLDGLSDPGVEGLGQFVAAHVQQARAHGPVDRAVVQEAPNLGELGTGQHFSAVRDRYVFNELGAGHHGEGEHLRAQWRHSGRVFNGLLVLVKCVAERGVNALAHARLAQVVVGAVLALVSVTVDALLTAVAKHVRVMNTSLSNRLWRLLGLRLRLWLRLGLLWLLR